MNLTYFEVNTVLHLSNIHVTASFVIRVARLEDFRLQKGEVIDADLVLFAADSDENILALEHLHLRESPARNQVINCKIWPK